MKKEYRYFLEKYKSGGSNRYRCPACGKKKAYTRYVDRKTGEYLPYEYGKCSRLTKCKYDRSPYRDGYSNRKFEEERKAWLQNRMDKNKDIMNTSNYFIPQEVFRASLKNYQHNHFFQFLSHKLGASTATNLASRFQLGTSRFWKGATVFWLIDDLGNVRGGQVVLYDQNGHTIKKDGKRFNSWVHTAMKIQYQRSGKGIPNWLQLYIKYAEKFPCPFGLPQVHGSSVKKPIGMVESAKTAMIATAYLPQYTWMAIGSLSYLNKKRILPLFGKKIVLYPDNGAYNQWSAKAQELQRIADVSISDILERPGMKSGSDIADYLIQHDVEEFRSATSGRMGTASEKLPEGWFMENGIVINEQGYPASWD